MKAMILIPFHHRNENIQIDANTVRFEITLVRDPCIHVRYVTKTLREEKFSHDFPYQP